jgi:hypothetical protein
MMCNRGSKRQVLCLLQLDVTVGNSMLYCLRFEDDCGVPGSEGPAAPASSQQSASDICRHIFFKVIMKNIGRKKRGRSDFQSTLNSKAMGVVAYKVLNFNMELAELVVDSSAIGDNHSAQVLCPGIPMKDVVQWSVKPDMVCGTSLESCSPVAALALKSLVEVGAFEGRDGLNVNEAAVEHADLLKGLTEMLTLGFAKRHDVGTGVSEWFLSQTSALKLGFVLFGNVKALKPRADIPVLKMTLFELIDQLTSNGWKHEAWCRMVYPSGAAGSSAGLTRNPPPEPVIVNRNGPKIWYVKAGAKTIDRRYLQVLLNIGALQAAGISEVKHLQNHEYYSTLLGINSRRRSGLLGFQDDDGGLDSSGHTGPREIAGRGVARVGIVANPGRRAKGLTRAHHPETHQWGPALITMKPPNQWQATCHRCVAHRAFTSKSTKCKSHASFKVGDEASKTKAKHQLWHWVNEAHNHATRQDHMNWRGRQRSDAAALLSVEYLESQRPAADYESDPGTVVAIGEHTEGKGGRGRGRRGRGRGRGAAPAGPAGHDDDEFGSDSSSSSSSSKSSPSGSSDTSTSME